MSKIKYIKDFYNDPRIQEDIHHDSLTLLALNMSHNFKKHNKRRMDKKDVDKYIRILYYALMDVNNIPNEFNQTS